MNCESGARTYDRKSAVSFAGENILYMYSSLPLFEFMAFLTMLILKKPAFPAPSTPEVGVSPLARVVKIKSGRGSLSVRLKKLRLNLNGDEKIVTCKLT